MKQAYLIGIVAATTTALLCLGMATVLRSRGQSAAAESLKPHSDAMNDFKKPDESQLRKVLSPAQFAVTQQCGTEPPFRNAYWDNHKPGIYVDVISGEPLFSSLDKFDSGSGWPSFTRPLAKTDIVEKADGTHGM